MSWVERLGRTRRGRLVVGEEGDCGAGGHDSEKTRHHNTTSDFNTYFLPILLTFLYKVTNSDALQYKERQES